MVSILIKRDLSGLLCGFTCSGHADYSDKGFDIVCSGISALTQTTLLALNQLVDLELQVEAEPKTGFLDCKWSPDDPLKQAQADLLVGAMRLGLSEIQKLYPKNLKLLEVEV
ncbi:hypothetical protein EDC14_101912 [Hydrogenispora ethanolica]|uniref:Ribosomal processing cysteine protease Prp n=1 Tax=Hydrogenispora ethanolica TaxID=1082276 RepID=A0A4V2QDF5_HYDET|nr:ribosomal-processing cysteine protease Prp [Hydrogenispora ethanolica]TCL64207.1 hypothetical protein EDC14_101912 [Hydrogenispora ethanolica]